MACTYFDLAHGGYFENKDLEDILLFSVSNLSRAQVKRLVAKVNSEKDKVSYRAFCDRPAIELVDGKPVAGADAAAPAAETADSENTATIDEDSEEAEADKVQELGLGFRAYLRQRSKASEDANSESGVQTAKDGICSYRGSIVDVRKLMSQLERSEKARGESEARAGDYLKSLNDLKEASEKHNAVRDKLQSEGRDLKKRLRTAEDDLKRSQTDTTRFFSTLKEIHTRAAAHVNKPAEQGAAAAVKKEEPATETPPVNGASTKTEAEAE